MKLHLSLLTLLLASCGVLAQPLLRAAPRWYTNPPNMEGSIVGVGRGTSAQEDIAVKKAILEANTQIARQVEPVLRVVSSRIDSLALGDEAIARRVTRIRESVRAELRGTAIAQRAVRRSWRRRTYTAFVLVELPEAHLRKAFVERLMADEEIRGLAGEQGLPHAQ